jgi:hypothetical protein
MATILAALTISSGCDSTSFVPPPPPPSGETLDPGFATTAGGPGDVAKSPVPVPGKHEGKRPGAGARVVELLLARPADPDRQYLALALRRELGKVRTIFRMTQPESDLPFSPKEQADAIRAAVGRGVAGLVVEPREEPAVVDALYEAVGRGIAVLLLDRTVPARGGKTIPRVEFVGFADVGRQIVEDVLEADRSLNRADPGRIIVLHYRSDDPYLEPALASLLGPCKASGKPTEVITFEGTAEKATDAVRKSLKADPKGDILLADDTFGMVAGLRILNERDQASGRDLLVGGYIPYDTRMSGMVESAKALGDRSVESYALKTSQGIRNLLDGKTVGEVVEVPITFHRRPWLFVPQAEKAAATEKSGIPSPRPN